MYVNPDCVGPAIMEIDEWPVLFLSCFFSPFDTLEMLTRRLKQTPTVMHRD